MFTLTFGTRHVTPMPDESVLQALTRQGISVRSSCRGGICQTCLLRCITGDIPARAQRGLSAELIAKRYFMPCVCIPANDMQLAVALTDDPPNAPAPERPKDPPPDPALWQALGEGALMQKILVDFYARVYADAQLKPFFSGFTQQRLIEKQYSFLQQAITGNKVFFGNRPRNSHHWMVISDDLFDHRERLMLDCMRAHGLAEHWVQRWAKIENHYRSDIVKTHPIPREINGKTLPLEGFEELILGEGSICDACHNAIETGETARYHLRMGTLFCTRCTFDSFLGTSNNP